MANLTARELKLTWWQTTDMIELAFAIPGAEGEQPASKEEVVELSEAFNALLNARSVHAAWPDDVAAGPADSGVRSSEGVSCSWSRRRNPSSHDISWFSLFQAMDQNGSGHVVYRFTTGFTGARRSHGSYGPRSWS